MTGAKKLFDQGRLGEAVEELTKALREKPLDGHARVFLFELLCFQGAFERAAKQLEIIAAQSRDANTELAIQVYRDLAASEVARLAVFHGKGLPKFLAPPPPYVEQYVMLVKQMADGAGDVGEQLGKAEDATPAIAGRAGERAFAGFRDADDRVAPVLEVFSGGEYLWVPFEQITRLRIIEPKRLRELVWAPATLEACGQDPRDVFLPVLYVDSWLGHRDEVKLGKMTVWDAIKDQVVVGAGQRVFLLDDQDASLLELGEVEFQASVSSAQAT
jgi:type VI secretion system protein ImpE